MPSLMEQLPYVGVVVVLLLSGLGLPLPEDMSLLWGGYLCGAGHASIYLMLPLALVGVLGSDLLIFGMGRLFGERVTRLPLLRRFLSPRRLKQAAGKLHTHCGKTLFLARFLPGLRMPVFFTAGTFRVPVWKMLAFDGAAALISVPMWVLSAYFFASHIENLLALSRSAQLVLAGAVGLAAVGLATYWYCRRGGALPVGPGAPARTLPMPKLATAVAARPLAAGQAA